MSEINKINVISADEAKNRDFVPILPYKHTPPDVVYDNIKDPVVVERYVLNKLIKTLNLTHKDFRL